MNLCRTPPPVIKISEWDMKLVFHLMEVLPPLLVILFGIALKPLCSTNTVVLY